MVIDYAAPRERDEILASISPKQNFLLSDLATFSSFFSVREEHDNNVEDSISLLFSHTGFRDFDTHPFCKIKSGQITYKVEHHGGGSYG